MDKISPNRVVLVEGRKSKLHYSVLQIQISLTSVSQYFDVLPNFPFTTSETRTIITYKHGIYELLHELPNNVRLGTLGN